MIVNGTQKGRRRVTPRSNLRIGPVLTHSLRDWQARWKAERAAKSAERTGERPRNSVE